MNRRFWMAAAAVFLLINALGVWRGLVLYESSLDRGLAEPALTVHPASGGMLGGRDPIVWRWDQPVIDDAAVGTSPGTDPAVLQPALPGAFTWIDDRTLEFVPRDPWPACVPIHADLDTLVTNLQGRAFLARHAGVFEGPPLQWLSTEVLSVDLDQEMHMSLRFNQSVKPEDLGKRLRVTDNRGRPVSVQFRETPVPGEVFLTVAMGAGPPLTLTLQPGLASALGPQGATILEHTVRVEPPRVFDLVSVQAAMPTFGPGEVEVGFSSPPDLSAAREAIRIEPSVEISIGESGWWRRNQLRISGDFQPGHTYTLRIHPDMRGVNGEFLRRDVERLVLFPERKPGLRFSDDGRILNAAGSKRLRLETQNEGSLSLELRRVHDSNLLALHVREEGLAGWESREQPDRGLTASVWRKTMPPAGNGPVDIDLSEAFEGAAHGVYRLRVTGRNSDRTVARLLFLGDLGLLARRHQDEFLVWTVRLVDGRCVAGADVEIWSETRQSIVSGVTDENGLVRLRVPSEPAEESFVIIGRGGGSLGVLTLRNDRAFPATNSGRPYLAEGNEAYLYTDRGVYRPGETVHLRAIVRGPGFKLPGEFPVRLALHGSHGLEYWSETRDLGDLGTVEISMPTDADWPNGRYTFSLSLPGDDAPRWGQAHIDIESFVPPQVIVEVDTPDGAEAVPPNFTVVARAHLLYGSPAAEHAASAELTVIPEIFRSDAYPEHSFADDRRPSFSRWTRQMERSVTDRDGRTSFEIEVPDDLRGPSALRAVVSVTVDEFSGRPATAFLSRRVDRMPRYLGVKATPLESNEADVDIVAVAPDGSTPAGELEVDLAWFRVSWTRGYRRDSEGRFTYVSERVDHPEGSLRVRLVDGRAAARIRLPAEGAWRVAVADADGGSASTELYQGGAAAPPARADRVEIVLDREEYLPGDVAELSVHPPFAGRALVTIESDRIWFADVIELSARGQTVPLAVPECDAPNAWVRVSLIRPQPGGGAQPIVLAEGAAPLRFQMAERRLALELDAPPDIVPARSVGLVLRGSPGAEVVVAGVDEGILWLNDFATPDPYGYFSAARRYDASQWDVFDSLVPELADRLRPGDPEAGGDAAALLRHRLNPIDANRFRPLAWWSGAHRFPESGELAIEAPVPEFTGRIRWMAVQAGASGAGSADAYSHAARAVVAQQSLPLFLAPGDATEWILRLHNRSDSEQSIEVRPHVTGPVSAQTAVETVAIEAGEVRILTWNLGALDDVGVASAAFAFSLDGLEWTDEIELAVRPAEAYRAETVFTVLAPGETLALTPWDAAYPRTAERNLRVSAFPTLQLSGAVDYLMRYPYGCLEQRVSIAFPLLLVPELAGDLAEGARSLAQSGVFQVWSMQLRDGSFSYWPGGRETDTAASLYAVEFLLDAKSGGLDVDSSRLDASLDWIRAWLNGTYWLPDDARHDTRMTQAAMVLAKAGALDRGWAQRLRERRADLPAPARIHAAEALVEIGERPAAAEMLRGIDVLREDEGAWFTHTARNADLLRVLLRIDPTDARIPGLVEELMRLQRRGRWAHSYENAAVIRALAPYARAYDAKTETPDVRWTAAGERIETDTAHALEPSFAGEARNHGSLPVYVREFRGGVPRVPPGIPNAFAIERHLLTLEGEPVDEAATSGDTLLLHLGLTGLPGDVRNLVIDQRLPAGLEPLPLARQRGAHAYAPAGRGETPVHPEHLEVRDDRFLIFPPTIHGNRADFHLLVRAVAPGRYILPAPHAQGMYDEAMEARGETGILEVRR